jgi:hypothetical protein
MYLEVHLKLMSDSLGVAGMRETSNLLQLAG